VTAPASDPAVAARIDALVARLDLERKVRLLTGASAWTTHEEPAVGLRAMVLSDGPAGVRGQVGDDRDPSAGLPAPTALAATWDEALVERLGRLLAAEARRKHVAAGRRRPQDAAASRAAGRRSRAARAGPTR
jgi:beta-glucosidase